jgi:hypothetical protein
MTRLPAGSIEDASVAPQPDPYGLCIRAGTLPVDQPPFTHRADRSLKFRGRTRGGQGGKDKKHLSEARI